jgi:hypothetical protein
MIALDLGSLLLADFAPTNIASLFPLSSARFRLFPSLEKVAAAEASRCEKEESLDKSESERGLLRS